MKNQYRGFTIRAGVRITRSEEIYHRTASGKGWRAKPDSEKTEDISPEFYSNCVRAVPVFNGLFGGSCRADWGYTFAGYIPVRITRVNPDRSEKRVDIFRFYLE